MFKNYLKVAFRNLVRNRTYSIINIFGLSLGMIACMLISLYVWDEFRYDQFQKNKNTVYRVYNEYDKEGDHYFIALTPPTFAPMLKSEYPEVKESLRMMGMFGDALLSAGDFSSLEANGAYAPENFFDFFSYKLKYGDPEQLLIDPMSIVLSSRLAKKYFGDENPIGKTITYSNSDFQVTGVFEDMPEHSHLQLSFLISANILDQLVRPSRMENWVWQQFYTYIKLEENVSVAKFKSKLTPFAEKYAHAITEESGFKYYPHIQRLDEIYLTSTNFRWDIAKSGNITYIYAFSAIGLFILLIGIINFVNLSTARAVKRALEVGVRKTVGANRWQLIFQFLGESVFLALLSVVLAGFITELLIPSFNTFTGKSIEIHFFNNPLLLGILFIFSVLTGILAGFYPALVLSGFAPGTIIKGNKRSLADFALVRKVMVVIQFALSGLLILSTIVVYKQLSLLQSKDLGFTKNQVLEIPIRSEKMRDFENAKNQLKNINGVSSVTACYGVPGSIVAGDGIIDPTISKQYSANLFTIDEDYLQTLEIKLVAGRDFNKESGTDRSEGFILNESAVAALGFGTPDEALGRPLHWELWGEEDSLKKGEVIGVINDFHFKSLHEKVAPSVFLIHPEAFSSMLLKIESVDVKSTLAEIEVVYNKLSPDWPFDYHFIDERYNVMYEAEEKMGRLFTLLTLVALFVASFGLFGLVSYTAEQRQKEIGIRKVFGASIGRILILMMKDFTKLVIIAAFIGLPITYFLIKNWLNEFAYHINFHAGYFLTAITSMLFIAWITVSYQSLKSALKSPVNSLRGE